MGETVDKHYLTRVRKNYSTNRILNNNFINKKYIKITTFNRLNIYITKVPEIKNTKLKNERNTKIVESFNCNLLKKDFPFTENIVG